jgi:hypothetical protein
MKTTQTNISEVRLVYRTKVKASERLQIKSSKDAFDIFMGNWDLDSTEQIDSLKVAIKSTGLELMDDKKSILVEKIKRLSLN